MTQDRNQTFVKALRTVLAVTLMLLTGSNALAQSTGVKVNGSVFGGGNLATVGGSVTVNIKTGTVEQDVYGGGALANTNINNATNYGKANESISSTSTNTTTVNLTGGTIKGDAYGGGLGKMGTAVEGVHWTQEEIDAAQEGDPAFGKTTSDWKVEPVAAGADGAGAVKAMVYGDINVNLGSSVSGSSATAFHINSYTGDHENVVKSGRLFGCNNLNGSPKGDVTVTVWKTVYGNTHRSESADKTNADATYELAAVYGGGNLASFTTANKKTHVIINGCSDTSIKYVYGGGNAAAVPETDVDINAAYEIGYVFGGGNGKDQYTLDGTTWINNPGANVDGNANTVLTGGVIHEAFGGSNEKGAISGSVSINTQSGGACDLSVGKLYGAGKNADIEGDLIVILGCMPGDENPTTEVYGGAENANVKGNVELTITSGSFGKVFGGNNQSGAIFGHIKLNIEETGCTPIKIDELYLGGNMAAYSVYGYYQDGTIEGTDKPLYRPRTSATDEHTIVTFNGKPHTVPDATTHQYDDPELNIVSATSIGKVFGGGLGADAIIYGNPIVNINMIKGTATGSSTTDLGTIGDVFGGGNEASVIGNPTVNIGTETTVQLHQSVDANGNYTMSDNQTVLGANILGDVFGGGNKAEVSGNSFVNICGTQEPDSESENGYKDTSVDHSGTAGFAVSIGNSVYGGGNAADVLGNTFVTMADGYVFNGIFGGGLAGSVGTYTRDPSVTVFGHTANHDGCIGKPTACTAGGTCYVVVSGGQIGPDEVATKGMNRITNGHLDPVPQGWVWGGGCGIVEDPATHPDTHFKAYVNNTDVTIKDNAFILESIIGGGEFGRVLGNTLVKIKGGQIGVGYNPDLVSKPVPYNDDDFVDPTSTQITTDKALAPCSHLPFGKLVEGKKVYKAYDPYATDNPDRYPGGSTDDASDGKTWIGCVFAGGSGYMPVVKAKDTNDKVTDYDWISSAGWVEGNAEVRISGGHILTNVYGGNEVTSVQGTSTVRMSGGTIGVPRTKEQIEALPMTGYLFGAGKGDPRAHFDTYTNVQDVEIEITGGIIYGSVYGGSEDGHVLGNVTIGISDGTGYTIGSKTYDKPIIGTCGTSYFDGNVFGGGRGFSGDNLNAGSVGGKVTMNITGGKMLGSVYGGGRLGSVNDDITIAISGGTIGNSHEYAYDADHELTHTKGGNVFAGGMGRMYQLDGTTPISAVNWWELGSAKSTKVTISDNAVIKSCIYGGGELGYVTGTHTTKNAANQDINVGTEVIISGGTIGTEIKDGETVKYTFGSVFGGGYGSLEEKLTHQVGNNAATYSYPKYIAGRVKGGTKVSMTAGVVLASVYGGGEMAAVGESVVLGETLTDGLTGDTRVIVSGGTIGMQGFGGAKMGNVYGGGSGHNNTVRSGHVYGNSNVTISGTDTRIYHNVYGGGAYGSVGDFVYSTATDAQTGTQKVNGISDRHSDRTNTGVATVTITGGTIGINGKENGMVFGSSRGDINQPDERDDYTAWVYDANVTIGDANGGPAIKGSVYGSGENGHTFNDAVVTINNGTIGIAEGEEITYTENGQSVTKGGAAYPYRGNVYGGGCGTDKYYENHAQETHDGNGQLYNPLAGIVYGSATVNINGGTVVRNVYGAGAMGSVGKVTTENETTTVSGGQTTINISSGTIGVDGTAGEGNVFGAARGSSDAAGNNLALVAGNTSVSITGGTMYGNVYGGGELGYVGKFKSVTNTETGSKTYTWPANTGHCEVAINGASATVKGHVFGAGKGSADTYECEPAMVYSTSVTIGNGTVDGKVYGGGQLGRVENNTVVTIGAAGDTEGSNKPHIKDDVFGAGAGVATHGYSALVRGNSTVTVQGKANVDGSVYGGGETASVGRFVVNPVTSLPTTPYSGGTCTVTVNGGAAVTGDIFGACKGVTPDFTHNEGHWMNDNQLHAFEGANAEKDYLSFLKTLALTSNTNVTIDGSATIDGNVFGGGQRGITLGTVAVNMNGGTVNKDVYGGGALADTNTGNATGYGTASESLTSTSTYTTTVNLLGGTIKGDAYGGGLGQLGTDPIPAKVYGDVAVNLGNVTENVDEASATAFWNTNYTEAGHTDVVKSGRIFGCNNLNGTPLGNVTVTVNRTVAGNVTRTTYANLKKTDVTHTYEVAAVYGGGNLAGYVPSPTVTGAKLKVLINSCDVSIDEVYGGGNAAPVPTTYVEVMGAYEINQVFGGGNGKDEYTLNGTDWIENPGANIGGNTNTILKGGLIHEAYGGSNEKGEIAGDIVIDTGLGGSCTLDLEKMVGAGKNADVNGNLIVVMGCKPETKIPLLYAGADNANVNGNVELTITSGNFGKVFGGNNEGGAIRGHIIVNIEETGTCETPITIDELYLGGNMAAYSRFGYYIKTSNEGDVGAPSETPVLTEGRLTFMPRTSADDTHKVVKTYNKADNTWEVYAEGEFTPYDEPVLNVVSCTRIDKVFGGGYGVGGAMYANPTVNINMIQGTFANDENKGVPKVMSDLHIPTTENASHLGIIGDVYGGGNAADVIGNTTVNIGTAQSVKLHESFDKTAINETHDGYSYSEDKTVLGAYIIGNVFGGGQGKDDTFDCEKAMVGKEGDGVDAEGKLKAGGTTVIIANGTVKKNVYGGGEIGRVERNTSVTIGLESGTGTPVVEGNVFGGGKGKNTHGYSALVRGNPTVTVQGKAKVVGSVYGGGEIASVGRYKIADAAYHTAHPEIPEGMPYSLASGGKCTVIIKGDAEIGPNDMQMPMFSGNVFGAGRGVTPGLYDYANPSQDTKEKLPCRMMSYYDDHNPIWEYSDASNKYIWEYFETEAKYLTFVETLALATETDVTIDGNAFVKGSVYGGSENGIVKKDTYVKIQGGQIGNGDGINKRYTDQYGAWPTETQNITTSWKECAHWAYDEHEGAPYDPFATSDGHYPYTDAKYSIIPEAERRSSTDGGKTVATDGHTFYGNVFGGGSGYFPYAPGKWHRAAGAVYGNTKVDITGGHILTNVYGGNEHTDVGSYTADANGALTVPATGGLCEVNMSDGTVGVPRTVGDINALPMSGYIFGAGKGDQRIFFNTWTNVINTEVNITGGRIYGSALGGGEDGHVIEDVEMTIGKTNETGPTIGTTGASYFDGNVFGGGRGFSGEAQTAGTVGGNVNLDIKSGSILGNVYGGGRLASVGTQFTAPDDDNYGNFVEDNVAVLYVEGDELPEGKNVGDVKISARNYGHVTINISGGTIGNAAATGDGAQYSGNVFGGSMGRLDLLNGTRNPIWPRMAQVKTTAVNVYGDAEIKRTVYGGGELGTVRDNAYVTIGGIKTADVNAEGVVGVEVKGGGTVDRDVYGGGYGSEDDDTHTIFTVKELENGAYVDHTYAFTPMQFAGCVGQNTYVHICGGRVKKSVYGGGELASVGVINCRAEEVTSEISTANKIVLHDNVTNKDYYYLNMVKHAPVEVDGKDVYYGFGLSWPYEFSYVPTYNGATHVHITGGRIGLTKDEDDNNPFEDKDNGDVCGGGKGKAGDYNDYVFCANVGSAEVIVNYTNSSATPTSYKTSGDCIAGAVYGGAENGHVMGDTKLKLMNGLVGHSIYGGGSGKGTFSKTLLKIGSTTEKYTRDIYSITAGKVFGNTEIEMTGGIVVRNVYGGGNMGSVGKGNYSGGSDDYSATGYGELPPQDNQNLWDNSNFLNSGKCTVKITGGTVGYINESSPGETMYPLDAEKNPYDASLPYGNVFGGCRGEAAPNITESPRYLYCPEFFVGYANETIVEIGKKEDGSGPKIAASVYGGGMDGHVRRDASVTIYGGEIGAAYDANKYNSDYWMKLGNVYGAGSGVGKYKYDFDYDGKYTSTVNYNGKQTKEEDNSTSAGSVTRFTKVEIQSGNIYRNVYGGGSLASVGAPKIGQTYDEYRKGDTAEGHGQGKQTMNEVIIAGGHIGGDYSYDATTGNHVYGGMVYGGSRGSTELSNAFSTGLYTAVNIIGGADVKGDVYGGGEAGAVKCDVDVNITGGTIGYDVYGGGALADTQISNWGTKDNPDTWADATKKSGLHQTKVNILGGSMRDVYGGGLGRQEVGTNNQPGYVAPIEAKVYGDVFVNLNGFDKREVTYDAITHGATEGEGARLDAPSGDDNEYLVKDAVQGAVVSRIFGCNNLNGSPQGGVKVHVFKTQRNGQTRITNAGDVTTAKVKVTPDANGEYNVASFDVQAVYGGGNMAAYVPKDLTTGTTQVVIDGCERTSIGQVYGGGNAASTPATELTVNGSFEIAEVFGGGNGKDKITIGGVQKDNPGANVGFYDYSAVESTYDTKEKRQQDAFKNQYVYGSGKAAVNIFGGTIHRVFGGSNTKGNVRLSAITLLEEAGGCDFCVDEAYGGGKSAPMDAEAKLLMSCIPGLKEVYGGAQAADVYDDVTVTVTNGTFDRVFGGNNLSGTIRGKITVNVEETGCRPVIIGELYGGGNQAAYSVYGYKQMNEVVDGETKLVWKARESDNDNTADGEVDAPTNPYADPQVNVKSFTSIGNIYGGGYGAGATMVGNPTVNINETFGSPKNYPTTGDDYDENGFKGKTITVAGHEVTLPSHKKGQIGAVNDIFGGGNAAEVIGNTNVNIGTEDTQTFVSVDDNPATTDVKENVKTVVGADIRGNVYGGGNNAEVTGNTNVTIGKKKEGE